MPVPHNGRLPLIRNTNSGYVLGMNPARVLHLGNDGGLLCQDLRRVVLYPTGSGIPLPDLLRRLRDRVPTGIKKNGPYGGRARIYGKHVRVVMSAVVIAGH